MKRPWMVGGLVLALAVGPMQRAPGAAPKVAAAPSRVDDRLRQAFGPEAPELARPIKFALAGGAIVVATGQVRLAGGAPALAPVSLALFARGKKGPITLRARQALLELDRPVTSLADITPRQCARVTLLGSVVLAAGPGQSLRADRMSVQWDGASGEGLFQATGNVAVRTRELNLEGCANLTLKFKAPAQK